MVPVVYEGMDDSCSICVEGFQHGQRVCRLSCRHVFHAECWERAQLATNRQPGPAQLPCPNCRGAGTVIAIWHYIDESRSTQTWGDGQHRAPNLLERRAVFHDIRSDGSEEATTPRSRTSSRTSSRTAATRTRNRTPPGEVDTPNQREDAQGRFSRWLGYFSGYFGNNPRAFHVQTRLPDGRPAIIVDPGSVGNLGGDQWCKEVAVAGSRAGKKPSYKKRPKPLSVSGVGHGSPTVQL